MADKPDQKTISQRLHDVTDWLKRVVTQPRSELTRWQKAARFTYDLGRHGARQLKEDNAPQMAAALSFRTLFALFPIVVVSTVLFQGLRGVDRFHELVGDLVEGAGLDDVQVVPLNGPVEDGEQPDTMSLGEWVQEFISQVGDVNLETLGWIGLAVLIYAAIAMMATIEDAFNTIYRAPEGRSWLRRVPVFWTVLTVAPIAVGLIFFLDARVDSYIQAMGGPWQWIAWIAGGVWSFTIIWLTMLGLYVIVPNTRVAIRQALIGALVAAILIQGGKSFIGGYIATFLTTRQLYASLGLVPLFMFWLYIMWLVVLFGLEVAATLQSLGGRRLEEVENNRHRTGVLDPASILLVMEEIARQFMQGKTASLRRIAEFTSMPESTVAEMVKRLQDAQLVHRVDQDRDTSAVTLARPPERITADELMAVGFAMADDGRPHGKSDMLKRLREAQQALAADATLASMMQGSGEELKSEASEGR